MKHDAISVNPTLSRCVWSSTKGLILLVLTCCFMTFGNDRTESAQFEYISQFLAGSESCMAFSEFTCSMPPPSTSTLDTWLVWLLPILKRFGEMIGWFRRIRGLKSFQMLWNVCRIRIRIAPEVVDLLLPPLSQCWVSKWIEKKIKKMVCRTLTHSLCWELSLAGKQQKVQGKKISQF